MGKVYVAQTKRTGRGIFAKSGIKRNDVIFVLKGRLVKDSYGCDYTAGPRWVGIGRNIWIDTQRYNPGYFINHSCSPNAGFMGKVTVVAMKAIRKGEEITMDYSTTEEDPYWMMECRCGSRNCRKTIRSVQFLPKEIFRKYGTFVPEFFRRSYLKAKGKT